MLYVLYEHNSATHSCILYGVIDMTAKTPACHLKIAHCGRFMPVTLFKIKKSCIKIFFNASIMFILFV